MWAAGVGMNQAGRMWRWGRAALGMAVVRRPAAAAKGDRAVPARRLAAAKAGMAAMVLHIHLQ
jgi:hypothetical protein